MYNRYIRNDNGYMTGCPSRRRLRRLRPVPSRPPPRPEPPPPGPEPAPPPAPAPERQFLNRLLAKLHLGDMDAGDLLLLLILFFLFYQKADEEVPHRHRPAADSVRNCPKRAKSFLGQN